MVGGPNWWIQYLSIYLIISLKKKESTDRSLILAPPGGQMLKVQIFLPHHPGNFGPYCMFIYIFIIINCQKQLLCIFSIFLQVLWHTDSQGWLFSLHCIENRFCNGDHCMGSWKPLSVSIWDGVSDTARWPGPKFDVWRQHYDLLFEWQQMEGKMEMHVLQRRGMRVSRWRQKISVWMGGRECT